MSDEFLDITHSDTDGHFTLCPDSRQLHYFKIYRHLCRKMGHFEEHIINVSDQTFQEHEKLVCIPLTSNTLSNFVTPSSKLAFQLPSQMISQALRLLLLIGWTIAPYGASTSIHPLARNSKHNCGFHNPIIGKLLCPTDLNWADPA